MFLLHLCYKVNKYVNRAQGMGEQSERKHEELSNVRRTL